MLDLYCNTGGNITIIAWAMYMETMGKVVAAKSYLRAWDSDKYLDTKGMFKTTLTTSSGAKKRTWLYVVAGVRPEPLLGDHDAEDLGIISFHPKGTISKDLTSTWTCLKTSGTSTSNPSSGRGARRCSPRGLHCKGSRPRARRRT